MNELIPNRKIELLKSLEHYTYVIGFRDGNIESKFLNITNNEFFYLYDNGSPMNNIVPKNLSTIFHWWFENDLSKRLARRLIDGILLNWNESDIRRCYESFISEIVMYIKNLILQDVGKIKVPGEEEIEGEMVETEETIDMRKFADKIFCRVDYL